MGYRSDVYIKTTTQEVDSDINFLTYAVEAGLFRWVGSTKLVCKDVKWYEDYKEVETIIELLEILGEDTFCLIAIGEDGVVHSELGDPLAVDLYTYTQVDW